jgi:23S rRNA pseudouridine1911/1915/1917 synthase
LDSRIIVLSYINQKPQRLDKFLVDNISDLSRSRIQALIKGGYVLISGIVVTKSGFMVDAEKQVEIRIPPIAQTELIPEHMNLEIVFENEDLLLINKPAGMVVHPSAGHDSGTLVHAVLAYAPNIEGVGGVNRPGVVHRLDKDTSGLIFLAKNDRAHQWLQNQFKERRVKKTYHALVDGFPPTPSGRIEAPIGRSTTQRKQMSIVTRNQGREAISEYITLERFKNHTLLEVHPETGRTHQIRVHMAFIHCPIVGDKVYGFRKPSLDIQRHFLHASRVTLYLPDQTTERTFIAPMPPDLNQVLSALRQAM